MRFAWWTLHPAAPHRPRNTRHLPHLAHLPHLLRLRRVRRVRRLRHPRFSPRTTRQFCEETFRLLRREYSYQPRVSVKQFLTPMAYTEQRILLLVDALRLFQAHIGALQKAAGVGPVRRQGAGQGQPGLGAKEETDGDGRRPAVIPRDDGADAVEATITVTSASVRGGADDIGKTVRYASEAEPAEVHEKDFDEDWHASTLHLHHHHDDGHDRGSAVVSPDGSPQRGDVSHATSASRAQWPAPSPMSAPLPPPAPSGSAPPPAAAPGAVSAETQQLLRSVVGLLTDQIDGVERRVSARKFNFATRGRVMRARFQNLTPPAQSTPGLLLLENRVRVIERSRLTPERR